MHAESGEVLFAKDEHKKLQVASISKLMTTLIVLEKIKAGAINLTDNFFVSEYAASMEGSQAFLDAGQEYSVSELLKSVIVASANDSAVVLAENIAGNEQAFVKMMNDRAKELKMHNTQYNNSTGLSAPDQYSTAFDTAIILKELSKHQLFNDDCQIWMDKLVHKSGRETELVNTNRLIRYYEPTLNGKTGFTDEAGYCLASTARRNGLTLIAVVLNTDSPSVRFKESTDLYNYGFANYENKQVLDENEFIDKTIKVNKGKASELKLVPENSFYVLNKKGDSTELSLNFELTNNASAPIEKGDIVGKCIVVRQGKVVGEVNIVAADTIEKQNFNGILQKIGHNWQI